MAVIDSNNFITHLVWSGLVDKATCGELKEAIELCTVKDIYTKADMVSMLTEIQLEFNKAEMHRYDDEIDIAYNTGLHRCGVIIQQKINSLKEQE